jgi:hypothetical protein
MSTQQSQAITELFNMKTSLQSMKGDALEPSHEPVTALDGRTDHHPMDASRNPELFSELCC